MEVVILLPVVFMLMFAAVQTGLWFHARAIALGAATEGAQVAAAERSSVAAGTQAATSFVHDAGGDGVLRGAGITGARSATTATITVTGTSQSLVPGWTPTVIQSASVPVERVTATP